MPDRIAIDEREKFDHSSHPTTRSVPGDLRSPSGGKAEKPNDHDLRGGVSQKEPVTPPDSATYVICGRRNSRVRRIDSRGSAHK